MKTMLYAMLLLAASSVWATTQIDFTVEDMIRFSHFAVQARVTSAAHDAKSGTGTYTFAVENVLFGQPQPSFTITLRETIIGMPRFEEGGDYVVFINPENAIEKVIGLQLGTLRVRDGRLYDYDGKPVNVAMSRLVRLAADAPPSQTMSLYRFTDVVQTIRKDLIRRNVRLLSE